MARQPDKQASYREERDFLGTRDVPADALYGIHTQRARENFDLDGDRLLEWPVLLAALAHVKVAAARANRDLGQIEPELADVVIRAAREIAAGRFHDHFPLGIVQGGGGTSTHMNLNEVLANRANELLGEEHGQYKFVHPNDHVNRSQSTNDVVPTAMGIAIFLSARCTREQLDRLHAQLLRQAEANEGLEHLGRTCLQDALPVPVSSVHRSQAYRLAQAMSDLDIAAARLLVVPLGATAVGTGFGAPKGYTELVIGYLRDETSLDIRSSEDPGASLASLEDFVTVAEAMARAGRVLERIAADLRLLASGPTGGLGEVKLPRLQPGSSSMPGKVNPVLPELVMQVSYQLAGAAHTIRLASGGGELELAVMGPVVTAELLRGLQRLGNVAVLFAHLCVADLSWQREEIDANLLGSLRPAVEASTQVGYDRSAATAVGKDNNL